MTMVLVYSMPIFVILLIGFLSIGVRGENTRAFINPLNNKAVDLFIVLDETRSAMTNIQFLSTKSAVNQIVADLNPDDSSPFIGVYFYGSTTDVNVAVPFGSQTSSSVKSLMDLKQQSMAQVKPSTLASALQHIHSDCVSSCREAAPAVTLIISSRLDLSATSDIRKLEADVGMTVIVVGIGHTINTATLNQLASHPQEYHVLPVNDYNQLWGISSAIASIISDVPRALHPDKSLYVSKLYQDMYHTVQINTAAWTTKNDTIVYFATNCPTCAIYGSLSETIPTATNTEQYGTHYLPLGSNTYPNTFAIFRLPQRTTRLYISVLGNSIGPAYLTCAVLQSPDQLLLSNALTELGG